MALQRGTTLGPYEIESPLGAGGMGEVYKARDTRLDRTVAIKVLPEHVAADPDLKQRFEREAKTVAALSHPHICPVFDVGEQDGINFLVMEYLEGETLAQRLEKGALPLDQALTVAIEIADALDKAHRQGIVHRDLKPGNIMLTKAGAKLLDFGLAKLKPVEQSGGLSALPTQGAPLTQEGAILGTFQYMAPEQLEGQEADARTDIFAFGAVVYEMVTGTKAFDGKSQASLISAVMTSEPPIPSEVQPAAPTQLDRIVTKCLSKDPENRWQTARDVTTELQHSPREPTHEPQPALLSGATALVGIVGVLAGVGLAMWWQPTNRVEVGATIQRLSFALDGAPPVAMRIGGYALTLSPDGQSVAYTGVEDGARAIYLRTLDEFEVRQVTTSGQGPFFSPNGQWIGFFSEGRLNKVSVLAARGESRSY